MEFIFKKEDFFSLARAEETCWLLPNGLGGYMSTTAAFSVNRCDTGLLVAAETAPHKRAVLVHRLSERLRVGEGIEEKTFFLSTQPLAAPRENGYEYVQSFQWDGLPTWRYQTGSVRILRRCGMRYGANTSAVVYEVKNEGDSTCILQVTPFFLFAPKGEVLSAPPVLRWEGNAVVSDGRKVYIDTNGALEVFPPQGEKLAYPYDARDGRPGIGYAGACGTVTLSVTAHETGILDLTFSAVPGAPTGSNVVAECARRQARLCSGFAHPVARELARSADAFLVRRDSTGGKSILAGYPYFADWGRDTMIALPGCALATGRCTEAKSILQTFLRYEKDGLIPNVFPEGDDPPMYNTVDAALLLIHCVWLYYRRTHDTAFVREAWAVLARIVRAYRTGTKFAIAMDTDGLIRAGSGSNPVTWMDIRIGNIVPTPRHGKPVEINAYWYNALCILRELSAVVGENGNDYADLAEQVRRSFVEKFWMEDRQCLRDVLSGTEADEQIRCNQIWAVSMPFSMLSQEKARAVVETVYRKLYTPYGLRTLAPSDPAFHPFYGGTQYDRDMAYHQGTIWPYTLGGFCRAWLRTHGNTPDAAREVEEMLAPMTAVLREGCLGQVPEIYDGASPGISKGCFAQAWSVGELLQVYEELEHIKQE